MGCQIIFSLRAPGEVRLARELGHLVVDEVVDALRGLAGGGEDADNGPSLNWLPARGGCRVAVGWLTETL